ncbi:MAG: hypothetical protein HY280_11150 [Nitrospinae bacterium]|nr:hypothetical protein [Nitrospinota bacterium]
MNKNSILAVFTGLMFLFGTVPAFAHEGHDDAPVKKAVKKPVKKPEPKAKDSEQHMAVHKMMLETHAIMLEMIKLIQKSAMDEDTSARAEALRKRMEDLINMHKGMAAKMHGAEGMMKMDNHGNMENMENMGQHEHMEHQEHMGKAGHDDGADGGHQNKGNDNHMGTSREDY